VLILAIPKSASTALVATLAYAHGLPVRTREVRDEVLLRRPIAPGFWHVAQFHRRDFVEVDAAVAVVLAAPGSFVKFHFPPTPTNQAMLRNIPKIVLVRNAEEIVSAYWRGEESGAWPSKSLEFAYCLGERRWQSRARALGLTEELRAWEEGWRLHDGSKLVIESAELLANPRRMIRHAERYLGLPESGAGELLRERYSRGERAMRGWPTILWGRRGPIAKRLLVDLCRLVTGGDGMAYAYLERRRRSRVFGHGTEGINEGSAQS
jgi:hypothetical protein